MPMRCRFAAGKRALGLPFPAVLCQAFLFSLASLPGEQFLYAKVSLNVSDQLVNWMEIKIHAVQNNSGLVAPTTALAHVLGQNSKAEWRMTIMERLVMNIGGWGGGCMGVIVSR